MNKLIINSDLIYRINKNIEFISKLLLKEHSCPDSLVSGKAGEVLFWSYYSVFKDDEIHLQRVVKIITDIFNNIEKGNNSPTFAQGLAGIGWIVEHLFKNKLIKGDSNKIIGTLDELLYPHMINFLNEKEYDYLHGALGIGLYYLERLSSENSVKEKLSKLVDSIEEISVLDNKGIKWGKKMVDINQKEQTVYNFGLAHGIPSIIAILSRIYEANISTHKTEELVKGAINFIQNNQKETSEKYIFPSWLVQDESAYISTGRLAWCYYDLGISMSLWQAGDIFNNNNWKQYAIKILLHSTKITNIEESRIQDIGLCHGAAGVAYMYGKMYRLTKIKEFQVSSNFWYEQCLKMFPFQKFSLNDTNNQDLKIDFSFLTGISGTGLALISAISDIKTNWDRALLLS